MIFDNLLKKLFGTPSDRYLKNIMPIIDEINAKYETMHDLKDDDLRARTQEMIPQKEMRQRREQRMQNYQPKLQINPYSKPNKKHLKI
jgi:preprotein translocase subunit SecA